jgi:hypothetical protein
VNSSTAASSSADSTATPDSTVRTVHVWQGSSAAPGMLELALQGAQWMQQYEHCVAAVAVPAAAEREGSESAAFFAALGVSALPESAGECSLYSDLQPPVTAPAAAAAAMTTLRRNDSQLDKLQLAVTADGSSRSSSAVSDSSSSSCTTATAAAAVGATLKHSEALSPQSPRGSYVLYECVRGSSISSSSNLSSSSNSSGAESSGFQWKHVAVYDDQDLAPDACLLLLHSGAAAASVSTTHRTDSTSSSSNSNKLAPSFVWVGEEFAADNVTDSEEQFVRRVTVTDGSWSLAAVSKLYFEAPGEESDKFWAAFEAGY